MIGMENLGMVAIQTSALSFLILLMECASILIILIQIPSYAAST